MIARGLLRSNSASKASSLVKYVASAGSLHGPHSFSESSARYFSSEPSLQADSTEENGFKGHGMLAPFTAGWQSTDLHPLVIDRSEGAYVYDINGKKYIDALAGLWCTALGGNEPRLVKAATDQLNKLPFYHSFWNRTTKPSLDLANEILSMFTAREMGKVFFTNSGSEANDSQVKLVWYYNNALGRPNKKKFIARSKSYHGSTLISASLSGLPALHQKFDLPAPFVLHTDCPHYWRFHLPDETEEEFATRLTSNLENLILKEGPETIAAFIAEPVMGAGGVIPPPKTYFEKIQAVLRKYDILFVADEVITAFGRLGSMFGCDMYNIKPDLVSIAKALSSAYMPIGATLVSPEIADVIHSQSNKLGSFAHGFTYSGHPVSCAVAIEALKIYNERNIIEHVKKIAPRFQEGIKAFSGSPIVGELRGLGLILGTEFVDNKSPNDPFPAEWGVGSMFGAECDKRGMLIRVAGDNIMLSPPLIMTPDEEKIVAGRENLAINLLVLLSERSELQFWTLLEVTNRDHIGCSICVNSRNRTTIMHWTDQIHHYLEEKFESSTMGWHDQKRKGASISLLACYFDLLSSSMLIEYYVRLLESDDQKRENLFELCRSAHFAKEKVEQSPHAMTCELCTGYMRLLNVIVQLGAFYEVCYYELRNIASSRTHSKKVQYTVVVL